MRLLRAALLGITLAAAMIGCSLFSDLDSFHEDAPAPADDSAAPDAAPPVEASVDAADTRDAPAVDAGPDASAYKRAVLEDQPVGYWPCDEEVGANVAKDIVGGKNAEATGSVTFGVPGADGTAIERAIGNGYLTVGDFFDLAGKQAFSVEVWAQPKGTALYQNVLEKRDDSNNGWVLFFFTDNGNTSVVFDQKYAAGERTTMAVLPNASTKLHHIVFVYDPTQPTQTRLRVYIDSVRTDGFSDDGDADDLTTTLVFVGSLVGVLDEVAIYEHALSAVRVAEHFKLGPK